MELVDTICVIIASYYSGQESREKSTLSSLIYCLLSTFGGGALFRDIMLLNQIPGCLGAPYKLYLCLVIAFWKHKNALAKKAIIKCQLPNDFATMFFLSSGIFKAIQSSKAELICIFCGIATATGGGSIAEILHRKSFLPLIERKKIYFSACMDSIIAYQILICGETNNILKATFITFLYNNFVTLLHKSLANIHNGYRPTSILFGKRFEFHAEIKLCFPQYLNTYIYHQNKSRRIIRLHSRFGKTRCIVV